MTVSRIVSAVALVAATAGAATQATTWRIGLRAFGPIRYGMTLTEASRALGTPVRRGDEYGGPGCSFAETQGLPAGVSIIVLKDRVARINVDTSGIFTLSGVQVGSTEDDVRRAYPGRIEVDTVHYDHNEGWHFLVFVPASPADSAYRVRFETDGRRVRGIRAGTAYATALMEGCL